MGMLINPLGFGVAGAGGAPVIRGSTQAASTSGSVVVTWPTGTISGDRIIMLGTSAWPVNTPSGWTTLAQEDGAFVNGEVMTKVLDATDISNGSVTVTFTGSYGELVSAIAFIGAPTVRGTTYVRDIGNGVALNSSGSALAGDSLFWFSGLRDGTTVPTISRGNTIDVRGSSPWGVSKGEILGSGGAVSAVYQSGTGFAFAASVAVSP